MAEHIDNDGTEIPQGGSSGPLPEDTKVQVTILSTNKGGSTINRRPYAKDASNPNSSITALAVRVSIDAGQVGAGRNLFKDIGLARKFKKPVEKHPLGAPNRDFGAFFRALGLDIDAPDGFTVPEDRDLIGKKLEVVLGIEPAYGEREETNNIKFINKATGIVTTQTTKAPASAPPATSGTWTPGSQGAGTPAAASAPAAPAPTAPQGWSPPGTPEEQARELATAGIQPTF
jgi:hypothetical protein